VETIKTKDWGYVWLYGYRPKSVSASGDDSVAEAAHAAIAALYKRTVPSFIYY